MLEMFVIHVLPGFK